MDKAHLTSLLCDGLKNLNIHYLEETDSTNNVARRLIDEGKESGLVVASSQTAGRGRSGHSFYSPTGSGIYMSYYFPFIPNTPSLGDIPVDSITSRVAVACAGTFEKLCGTSFGIKWVNDIYYESKKVAGILTEGIFPGRGQGYCVIGIGINVSTEGFPEDIKELAGALSLTGTTPGHEEIIAGVINEINVLLHQSDSSYVEEYKKRLMYVGEDVTFMEKDETVSAKMLGVDDECALLAELEDGTVRTIKNGEVSLLRPHRA